MTVLVTTTDTNGRTATAAVARFFVVDRNGNVPAGFEDLVDAMEAFRLDMVRSFQDLGTRLRNVFGPAVVATAKVWKGILKRYPPYWYPSPLPPVRALASQPVAVVSSLRARRRIGREPARCSRSRGSWRRRARR